MTNDVVTKTTERRQRERETKKGVWDVPLIGLSIVPHKKSTINDVDGNGEDRKICAKVG